MNKSLISRKTIIILILAVVLLIFLSFTIKPDTKNVKSDNTALLMPSGEAARIIEITNDGNEFYLKFKKYTFSSDDNAPSGYRTSDLNSEEKYPVSDDATATIGSDLLSVYIQLGIIDGSGVPERPLATKTVSLNELLQKLEDTKSEMGSDQTPESISSYLSLNTEFFYIEIERERITRLIQYYKP